MTDTANPLDAAQAELQDLAVPWPDLYVDDLTPPAAMLLCRQMVMAVSRVVLGAMASLDENPDEDNDIANEVLNSYAAALAGTTHAMVVLELLPPEAEAAS